MPLVQWNAAYSVKVAKIDQQHRQLLNIINHLHDVMRAGGSPEQVRPVVNELATYTRHHLVFEEKMLESAGYPATTAHELVHQSMVKQVEDFRDRVDGGDAFASLKLMAFLKDWLTNHILKTDLSYSSHVSSRTAA
jgi:hemerythrin-like metal-binding protein